MEFVLDFNVVFSALYGRGVAYKIFMLNHVLKALTFLVPQYFWKELEGKRDRLSRVTRLTPEEVEYILSIIQKQIVIIPENIVKEGLKDALKLSPDPKDVPYVALALSIKAPLLTGDLKLRRAVENRINVYSPSEVLELLENF